MASVGSSFMADFLTAWAIPTRLIYPLFVVGNQEGMWRVCLPGSEVFHNRPPLGRQSEGFCWPVRMVPGGHELVAHGTDKREKSLYGRLGEGRAVREEEVDSFQCSVFRGRKRKHISFLPNQDAGWGEGGVAC